MQNFIIALLICSATMSVLALIYMALTPLLAKRYSVKGRYYTWLVVVVGLIIPFRPQWGNAIIRINVPAETGTYAVQAGDQVAAQIGHGQVGSQFGNQIGAQIGNAPPVTIPLPLEDVALPSVLANVSWWQIAVIVWLAGLSAFLAYHIIKHFKFAKMVRRWSDNITDEQPFAILQNLKAEMGVSKQISLYQCSSIGSPMMIGFIYPRILLPKTYLEPDELYFILKHELVHYQRKDLYYKCLALIATAVHWFNPIVYLMAKEIEILCELSCDAETVRRENAETRQHYSETIIGLVRRRSMPKTVLSTNFYESRKGMKKRIFSIMDMGKKKAGMVVFCVMLVVTTGTGLAICSNGNALSMPADNGSSVKVGDVIQFGGTDWRVLEVGDGKALALSDKVLFNRAYHSAEISVSWEECDLRQYLNGEFYDTAFSAEEKERIVATAVENNGNTWYDTPGGKDTTDKIFLLSIEETLRYFGDSGEVENQQSSATYISDQYNEARIAQTQVGEDSLWWLRSPGRFYFTCDSGNHVCAATITSSGSLGMQGDYVNNDGGGVRPAMWLKL